MYKNLTLYDLEVKAKNKFFYPDEHIESLFIIAINSYQEEQFIHEAFSIMYLYRPEVLTILNARASALIRIRDYIKNEYYALMRAKEISRIILRKAVTDTLKGS
jgi:hypothetical protein